MLRRLLVSLLVLGMVLLVGCESGKESARDSSSLACDHFRNIVDDVASGVLTNTEIRTKLKEVDDNASIATPQVQAAARAMLIGITQNDDESFAAGVRAMNSACSATGH
jgi:hypothetical protein